MSKKKKKVNYFRKGELTLHTPSYVISSANAVRIKILPLFLLLSIGLPGWIRRILIGQHLRVANLTNQNCSYLSLNPYRQKKSIDYYCTSAAWALTANHPGRYVQQRSRAKMNVTASHTGLPSCYEANGCSFIVTDDLSPGTFLCQLKDSPTDR